MRRPSRQGLVAVCTIHTALQLMAIPHCPSLRHDVTAGLQSCVRFVASAMRVIALTTLLWSCKEEAPEIPTPLITVVKPGTQSIMAVVAFQNFRSIPVQEYGIAYGITPSPDITGNKYSVHDQINRVNAWTLRELEVNTTYYLRAYLIEDNGNVTYSPEAIAQTLLHEPANFYPQAASVSDEVIVTGKNFVPGNTRVYLNDQLVDSKVLTDTIKFFPPFGLDTDSLTIAVETGGVRISLKKKLRYLKGRWTQLKSYADDNDQLIGFIFFGLGIDGIGYVTSVNDYLKQNVVRAYDPVEETWRDITLYPDTKNSIMHWFAIRRQLFIIGENAVFWMYDIDADLWYPLPDITFPMWSWHTGTAFSFDNKGYVGLGAISGMPNHSLWKFENRKWEQLSDYPGSGTEAVTTLITKDAVYFVGGMNYAGGNQEYFRELWKYYPAADRWERKTDFPGNGSTYLNGVVLNDKLYVGGGGMIDWLSDDSYFRDFWEYSPDTDTWKRVADAPVAHQGMYAYTRDNDAILGGGHYNSSRWSYQVWKFEVD